MQHVHEVVIGSKPADSFVDVFGPGIVADTTALAQRIAARLAGRVIWNVNSTAAGGGVAEMLHTLLAYARGLGVDTRWLVISGNPGFFRVTKRIHNALHGERGDGLALDDEARRIYEDALAPNAAELIERVRPDDIAILHDPQTAGLIPTLVRRGVSVVWRCHIGSDVATTEGDGAWRFLARWLAEAHAFVFSRFAYLPEELYHGRCMVVPPCIDPFSPKNQAMDPATVRAILVHLGVIAGESIGNPRVYVRTDGSTAEVERRAEIVREGAAPAPDAPLVVQVSRWDRLKDPVGVLRGFVRATDGGALDPARLLLVGPSSAAVADDPEGAEVWAEVLEHWRGLSPEQRARIDLVNLPMDDLQENAAMVNALQRHAAVVVQKSLREGFGLTVTEAMWKARPVIASAVGGIQDQLEHGVSGLLLRHPEDVDAFAGSLTQLLGNRAFAERLGRNARRRASQNYLGLNILAEYDDLLERLDHERSALTISGPSPALQKR